ncbi:MAG: hypothetical protein J6X80_06085 [Lachnospiraceae bacterium]|nr:hypothetical protein [Lachnospiraceae bacterium]
MSELVIKEAGITDYDRIWGIIENVTPTECGKKINDYNIYHSKKSLGKVLSDTTYREKVLLALKDGNLVGVADFSCCYPDYLFFENEFGYIRYLIADDEETRKALYDEVKSRLRSSMIRYVATDVWTGDDEEYEELRSLGMKKHRTRLYKELVKEKQ